MQTSDFDFELPAERIAQTPAAQRDHSRMLVLHRATGRVEHRRFSSLVEYLRPGDALVLNNSKVIPARLRGHNARSGGRFEIVLLEENAPNDWWALLRPGKRARLGTEMVVANPARTPNQVKAVVIETNTEGHRRLHFTGTRNILERLEVLGEVPLPPYVRRSATHEFVEDRERYQTVYARSAGSVAAPTAGLHFTRELLDKISSLGVKTCFVTLHVGLGTFAPVKAETIAAHKMHAERYALNHDAVRNISETRVSGGRVFAVGTTTVRVLESIAALHHGRLRAGAGRTQIFIHPPYHFTTVDALLTNFHLPRSTLLMLVSAFAAPSQTRGREMVLSAYAEAIRERYRFFSYGDAMLLL